MSEKKVAEKAAENTAKAKKQAVEKLETVVYIGPNKLMDGLKQYAVTI